MTAFNQIYLRGEAERRYIRQWLRRNHLWRILQYVWELHSGVCRKSNRTLPNCSETNGLRRMCTEALQEFISRNVQRKNSAMLLMAASIIPKRSHPWRNSSVGTEQVGCPRCLVRHGRSVQPLVNALLLTLKGICHQQDIKLKLSHKELQSLLPLGLWHRNNIFECHFIRLP